MAEPRDKRASAFRQVPGLAPMLLASLLSRTWATMVGLSMGFVAYEQTTSALTVAIVASSFGLAFAGSSLVAGLAPPPRPVPLHLRDGRRDPRRRAPLGRGLRPALHRRVSRRCRRTARVRRRRSAAHRVATRGQGMSRVDRSPSAGVARCAGLDALETAAF